MSTKFFTNEGENTLMKKFVGVFEHNTDIEFFDALVGYFRASGYFSVRPYLDNVPHVRWMNWMNRWTCPSRFRDSSEMKPEIIISESFAKEEV